MADDSAALHDGDGYIDPYSGMWVPTSPGVSQTSSVMDRLSGTTTAQQPDYGQSPPTFTAKVPTPTNTPTAQAPDGSGVTQSGDYVPASAVPTTAQAQQPLTGDITAGISWLNDKAQQAGHLIGTGAQMEGNALLPAAIPPPTIAAPDASGVGPQSGPTSRLQAAQTASAPPTQMPDGSGVGQQAAPPKTIAANWGTQPGDDDLKVQGLVRMSDGTTQPLASLGSTQDSAAFGMNGPPQSQNGSPTQGFRDTGSFNTGGQPAPAQYGGQPYDLGSPTSPAARLRTAQAVPGASAAPQGPLSPAQGPVSPTVPANNPATPAVTTGPIAAPVAAQAPGSATFTGDQWNAYAQGVGKQESGNNYDMSRGNGGGYYQFNAANRTKYNLNANSTPAEQDAAFAQFTRDNAAALTAGGVQPTYGNLGLAHAVGVGGTEKLLGASPNASAASVIGAQAVAGQGLPADISVQGAINRIQGRYGQGPGGGSAALPSSNGQQGPAGASNAPAGSQQPPASGPTGPNSLSTLLASGNVSLADLAQQLGLRTPTEGDRLIASGMAQMAAKPGQGGIAGFNAANALDQQYNNDLMNAGNFVKSGNISAQDLNLRSQAEQRLANAQQFNQGIDTQKAQIEAAPQIVGAPMQGPDGQPVQLMKDPLTGRTWTTPAAGTPYTAINAQQKMFIKPLYDQGNVAVQAAIKEGNAADEQLTNVVHMQQDIQADPKAMGNTLPAKLIQAAGSLLGYDQEHIDLLNKDAAANLPMVIQSLKDSGVTRITQGEVGLVKPGSANISTNPQAAQILLGRMSDALRIKMAKRDAANRILASRDYNQVMDAPSTLGQIGTAANTQLQQAGAQQSQLSSGPYGPAIRNNATGEVRVWNGQQYVTQQ